MENRKIIGYNFKDSVYLKAAEAVTRFEFFNYHKQTEGVHIPTHSTYLSKLKELGVAGLWLNPVYETPKLEAGKWYKHPNGALIYAVKIAGNGVIYGYGFRYGGLWFEELNEKCGTCACNEIAAKKLEPATDKEVEQALIKEAKKRGFKEGVTFDKQNLYTIKTSHAIVTGGFKFWAKDNMLDVQAIGRYPGKHTIFENGKWASIVTEEKPTKEDLLKQINHLKEQVESLWPSL